MISNRGDDNGFESASSSPVSSDSDTQASSETYNRMSLELTAARLAIQKLESQKLRLERELKALRTQLDALQRQLADKQPAPLASKKSNEDAIEKLTNVLDDERNKNELTAIQLNQLTTLRDELRSKLERKTIECDQVRDRLRAAQKLVQAQRRASLPQDIFTGFLYVLGGLVVGGCVAAIIVLSGAFLVMSSPALSIVILAAILVPLAMVAMYALNHVKNNCCQPTLPIKPSGTTVELQQRMPRLGTRVDNDLTQEVDQSSAPLPTPSQVNNQAKRGAVEPLRKRSNR